MMGYGYGMMGFALIIPLLIIGLIVYGAVKLAQGSKESSNTRDIKNDAIDILNQRYAKGEISDEEYVQKKRMLKG